MDSNYSVIQQGDTAATYVMQVAADTLEDVANLPTSWRAGSSCICLEDSSVWMLNTKKVWVQI